MNKEQMNKEQGMMKEREMFHIHIQCAMMGGFEINFHIVPGRGLQVLPRERGDIGIHIISDPVGDAGAYGNGLEYICVCGKKG